jgi:hypothetical protein
MNAYLDFSVFASRSTYLLVSNKISVFLFVFAQ